MSQQWDKLDTNTRQYIALTSSGANQIQNFYALMSNFETAVNATNTAIESTGSAWRENARYMESIEAKTQKLKTAVENMILGDGGLEKLIKLILDVATNIVKFTDNAGGLVTVLGTLTGVLILLGKDGITKLVAMFANLTTATEVATVEFNLFGTTVTTTNTAINATAGVVGIVILALTGLVAVISYVQNAYSKATEKAKEANNAIETQKGVVSELESELANSRKALQDLQELGKIELVDDNQIRKLSLQTAELERQLAIEKENLRLQEEKANKLAGKAFNKIAGKKEGKLVGVNNASEVSQLIGSGPDYTINNQFYVDENARLDERVKKYIEIKKALEDFILAKTNENASLEEGSKQYKKNNNDIDLAREKLSLYNNAINDLIEDMDNDTQALSENNEYRKAYLEVYEMYGDALLENQTAEEKEASLQETIKKWVDDTTNSLNLTAEQREELNEKIQDTIANLGEEDDVLTAINEVISEYEQGVESATTTTESWSKQMDNLQSAYATLTTAVDEYNKTGQFSLDTVQDLLALSPEYLNMLQFENGQVRLNEEAIKKKALSLIDEAKAQVYKTAEQKLASLADKESSSSLDDNSQSLADNTTELLKNSKALYDNAYARAFQNGDQKEARKIYDETAQQIKTLDDLAKNLGTSFKKTFTDSKTATKQATEAVKENKEAVNALKASVEALKQEVSDMEDELDKYKKAISYINDKIDEEIDRLKELRDNETNAIEEKINLLEDEKRITEDTAKENIKKLEEERDAIVNSTKEQVEALQEKKSLEEEYWNKKIQALKDQNEALDDQAQLEQLLLNLEKAKNTKVRVYKEGQGFVWETDKQAVDKAQKELDKYYRKQEYEEQLRELEDFKKRSLDNYSEQIKNLNDYSNKVKNNYNAQIDSINSALAQKKTTYDKEISALKTLSNNIKKEYDTQIKYYEDYKKRFEKQLKAYETEQSRLLTLQLTGIDFEKDNWKTRLGNLDAFAEEYNKKLKALNKKQEELNQKQKELNNLQSQSSTTSSGGGGGNTNTTGGSGGGGGGGGTTQQTTGQLWKSCGKTFGTQTEASNYSANIRGQQSDLLSQINAKATEVKNANPQFRSQLQKELDALQKQYGTIKDIDTSVVRIYGSGTPYVRDDQVAIVGDNPNSRELVIGSKLNGMAMNLKKGTGVVNAQATNTLAGMFNALGSGSASKGNFSLSDIKEKGSQSIVNIGDISLPQVRDATDFINALGNFENIMAQRAYSAI